MDGTTEGVPPGKYHNKVSWYVLPAALKLIGFPWQIVVISGVMIACVGVLVKNGCIYRDALRFQDPAVVYWYQLLSDCCSQIADGVVCPAELLTMLRVSFTPAVHCRFVNPTETKNFLDAGKVIGLSTKLASL